MVFVAAGCPTWPRLERWGTGNFGPNVIFALIILNITSNHLNRNIRKFKNSPYFNIWIISLSFTMYCTVFKITTANSFILVANQTKQMQKVPNIKGGETMKHPAGIVGKN